MSTGSNRSALERVLDQSGKKPNDPTIAEEFNTHPFADHKAKVIDLLADADGARGNADHWHAQDPRRT
jgi:hypothetical protein